MLVRLHISSRAPFAISSKQYRCDPPSRAIILSGLPALRILTTIVVNMIPNADRSFRRAVPFRRLTRAACDPSVPGQETMAFKGDVRRRPLPRLAKLAYGLGGTVDGVTSNALNFFVMFYATIVCGLDGWIAGLALSLGLVVDAIVDPLIGSLSDGCRARLGRRLPFMLTGLPLTAVSLTLLFSIPPGLGTAVTFALLLIGSTCLRVSVSLFNLPFLAFGAELTDDHGERSSVAAWRWAAGMTGGLITIVIGFGIFFRGPGGTANRAAYSGFAMASAIAMVIAALGSLVAVARLRHRAHPAIVDGARLPNTFMRQLAAAARNRSFRVLFVATLLLFVGQGVTFTLNLHASTYFWDLDPQGVQRVALALFAGLLLGAPLVGFIAPRFEKRSLLLASLGGLVFSQTVLVSLRLCGLLPLGNGKTLALLTANSLLTGLSITGAVIAMSAMLADAADEHDLETGCRQEGVMFSGWSFSSKAAGGVGALIAGLALQIARFPTGAGPSAGSLSPYTLRILGFASGPGAAFFSFCGILVLTRYGLDRARHAAILQALQKRLSPSA